MVSQEAKKIFLLEILQRKDIIVGKFDDYANGKRKKAAARSEVMDVMKIAGVDKTVSQLRDVLWKNLRMATVKKIDEKRRTGSDGGADKRLTELDNLVLDIVGKDSAVVAGLDVSDSTPNTKEKDYRQNTTSDSSFSSERPIPSTPVQQSSMLALLEGSPVPVASAEQTTGKEKLHRKRRAVDEKEELLIENLRLRNEKLRLEIEQLRSMRASSPVF